MDSTTSSASGDPRWRVFWCVLYALVLAVVGMALSARYHPQKGFTALILFGDRFDNASIENTGAHVYRTSDGYDGQFYAKLALNPLLLRPFADRELDNPPYRANRILLPWMAAVFGLGDPKAVLHVYAALNIIAWFLLAALLLRWFPPGSLPSFVAWSGILLSTGMVTSLMRALVDGPSLLLLAAAMALVESGRGGTGSVMLGVSGLAKETNLLAAPGFFAGESSVGGKWRRGLLRLTFIFAPLCLWLLYVRGNIVPPGLGERSPDFSLPFVELVRKFAALPEYLKLGRAVFLGVLLPLVAFVCQAAFFAATYRCWRNPWWRIGASYAAIFVVLGPELFEGIPGAYTRAMLPLTLSFNILAVFHLKTGIPVLLLGNAWLLCPVLAFVVE